MAKAIGQDTIIKINDLYLEIGTYVGVSRALGGSPSPTTVKKYIIPDYKQKKTAQKSQKYNPVESKDLDLKMFDGCWDDLINIRDEEKELIEEVRKGVLF